MDGTNKTDEKVRIRPSEIPREQKDRSRVQMLELVDLHPQPRTTMMINLSGTIVQETYGPNHHAIEVPICAGHGDSEFMKRITRRTATTQRVDRQIEMVRY